MVHLTCVTSSGAVVEVGGWCPGGGNLTALVTTFSSPTTLTILRNNAVTFQAPVPAGVYNWTWAVEVAPPVDGGGVDRWRAELRDGASALQPRTLTNHIFIQG